jgi:hypothetical protein
MTTFDKRERAFEAKFAFDQETAFKIGARRNKLLGLWVAKRLGMRGADARAYADSVVASDFAVPGHDDVFEKVWRDIRGKDVALDADQVRRKMQELWQVAQEEITPNLHHYGAISAADLNRIRQSKSVWSWQRATAPGRPKHDKFKS